MSLYYDGAQEDGSSSTSRGLGTFDDGDGADDNHDDMLSSIGVASEGGGVPFLDEEILNSFLDE